MKAFLETLGALGNPKPNKHLSPKWNRSDYVALAMLALRLAVVYGFSPLSPILPQ